MRWSSGYGVELEVLTALQIGTQTFDVGAVQCQLFGARWLGLEELAIDFLHLLDGLVAAQLIRSAALSVVRRA